MRALLVLLLSIVSGVLWASESITLVILDATNNKPVKVSSQSIHSQDRGLAFQGTDDGFVAYNPVVGRHYPVEISKVGYATIRREVVANKSGPNVVEIKMWPRQSLAKVTVVFPKIPRGENYFVAMVGDDPSRETSTCNAPVQVEDGLTSVTLSVVPEAQYIIGVIRVDDKNRELARYFQKAKVNRGTTVVNIDPTDLYDKGGGDVVVHFSAKDIELDRITLQIERNDAGRGVCLDQRGNARLSQVPEGTWTVQVMTPEGLLLDCEKVMVKRGKTTEVLLGGVS